MCGGGILTLFPTQAGQMAAQGLVLASGVGVGVSHVVAGEFA